MATNSPYPDYDFSVDQDAIQRRQRQAEMLTQYAFQRPKGQMVSGHFVAPNIIEQLLPAFAGYRAEQEQDGITTDRQALAQKQRDRLTQGMERYFQQRDGQPARPGETLPTEDGLDYQMQGQPAVRGDPRRAAVTALTSGLPALARLGQSDLEALSKNQLTPKDLLSIPGATVASRVAAAQSNDPSRLAGDLKSQVVNNRILERPEGGPWKETFDGRAQFKVPGLLNGDLYQEEIGTGQFRKLDNAPKVTVGGSTVTLDKGKIAGMEKWSELAGTTVAELAKGARASAGVISDLNNIEQASQAGTYQTPFPKFAILMGQLATSMGVKVDGAKLANSELASSELIRLWVDMMAANGGARGLVKEESADMKDSLPQLALSPEGQKRILRVLRMKAEQDIAIAKEAAAQYSNAIESNSTKGFTFGLTGAMLPEPTMNPRPGIPGARPPQKPQVPGLPPGWTIEPMPAAPR